MPGRNIRLTILSSLQYEAQQACFRSRSVATKADSCTMGRQEQPSTCKILAAAQYPTFVPTNLTSVKSNRAGRAAVAVGVPARAAPPAVITAAAALEHGETPMTPYTVPRTDRGRRLPCSTTRTRIPTERLTLAGILAHSSNVGMVQVAKHVTPAEQYRYYRAFGVGVPTGLPLPDASDGLLPPPSKWWGDERFTCSPSAVAWRPPQAADGGRLRDDRQRRGPGVAEHRGRDDRAVWAVHARAAAAPPAGDQDHDRSSS